MSAPARKVTILDYGVGNLRSVARALEVAGGEPVLAPSAFLAREAERLVIPGVGAFASCIAGVNRHGFDDVIRQIVASGRPVLGICVGMQMLFEASEEFGEHAGLGLLPGRVRAIPRLSPDGVRRKVPHIGWSRLLEPEGGRGDAGTPLQGQVGQADVYFVHSFAAEPADPADRLADTIYGGARLAAAVARGNLTGVQFHPEKSGPAGLAMLRRFLDL